ncbi:MAG: hypothetical protein QF449_15930 [Alphaproteobacteria bacterium]|jgi:outer membrane protein assembly factor BamE (lipoprotein component of BamABCDE complex)|nr:hypothetical protein [Alphaproteobacteria bacterium]|tara:strand:- start:120 stop:512 length:393 start_codon:yes stop_codon:yes gene_type:complete
MRRKPGLQSILPICLLLLVLSTAGCMVGPDTSAVHPGATLAEVESVLGNPTRTEKSGDERIHTYLIKKEEVIPPGPLLALFWPVISIYGYAGGFDEPARHGLENITVTFGPDGTVRHAGAPNHWREENYR